MTTRPQPGDHVRFLRGDLKGQIGVWTLEKPGASVTLPSGTRVFNPGPVEIVTGTETTDLSTPEGRAARLAELVEQTRATARLPHDTDLDLLARNEAHQRNDEEFAELFRAEKNATHGNGVALWALLDAIGARTVSAQKWADRAEQVRARIAAAGDAR